MSEVWLDTLSNVRAWMVLVNAIRFSLAKRLQKIKIGLLTRVSPQVRYEVGASGEAGGADAAAKRWWPSVGCVTVSG